MDYAAIRDKIRTGDVLFWSHGSWASWAGIQTLAVRAFTLSDYSHAGVAWVVSGRVFVIHAIGRGVVIEPLSNQDSFTWCPMGLDYPEAALETALSRVGDEYSKWQAVTAFFKKLKVGADRLWECAEYVMWFWQQAGVRLGQVATPAALARYVQDAGLQLHWVKL